MPRVVPSQIVEFIDQTIPKAKKQTDEGGKGFSLNRPDQHSCVALVKLIDQLPGELLVLPGQHYIELVASVEAIKDTLEIWKLREYGFSIIPRFGDYNPISFIRRALSLCPDEIPSKDTAELIFIEDDDLRANLRIDISATNLALSNGEWKAATVLAGSVVEALLLWRLNQFEEEERNTARTSLVNEGILRRDPGGNLDRWELHPFIEVAAKLEVIGEDTAQQARLAQEYRNLIHPGREKRLGQRCDRGTALAAVAAAERVVSDLSSESGS
jgi:hypothetical protein